MLAGSSFEDAVEAGAQSRGAAGTRGALIEFQVAVEPPDQMADEHDSTTLVWRRRHQLVDEPLGVDPTKSVLADAELAGIIGHDDGIGKKAVVTDAPTSPLRWRS